MLLYFEAHSASHPMPFPLDAVSLSVGAEVIHPDIARRSVDSLRFSQVEVRPKCLKLVSPLSRCSGSRADSQSWGLLTSVILGSSQGTGLKMPKAVSTLWFNLFIFSVPHRKTDLIKTLQRFRMVD